MKQVLVPSFLFKYVFVIASAVALSPMDAMGTDKPALVLWYDQPAARWEEALAVGNGRLGAMVFGGPLSERLQLNEGTLWAGGPYDPVNPLARDALPEVRRLVREGCYREAAELISAKVMARPIKQMPYQTVGDLLLEFEGEGAVTDYRRQLDLETASATVTYTRDGVHYRREVFASAPANVIVMRLTADQPGKVSFTARMGTPMQAAVSVDGDDRLVMEGRGGDSQGIAGAVRFRTCTQLIAAGGTVSGEGDHISVQGADSVTLLFAAATNYLGYADLGGDPAAIVSRQLAAATRESFDDLRAAHVADYQRLFNRVRIDLGGGNRSDLPTNERIERFADGQDPALAALYFQFGRYLLISCSRPSGQPATLQGLWNESVNPPWESKYTININTEMNYWPSEPGNLSECTEPLIAMVEELAAAGAGTAERMYGARGWVAHHNTDLWRASAPIDGPNWGMWPTGGAWLCLHLWERYEFSGDIAVLKRIYPVMKGAAEFFLDTLEEDPAHGWLVTNPSISPENMHPHGSAICAGPTMDMQILRDLFANTIKAATILDVDPGLRDELSTARKRLAPNQIGHAGQLQEWIDDWDTQAPEIHHRHVSHLYGLYPGRDISLRETPELAAAARRSLNLRGDMSTGWATAWRICLWAHLGDGDHAYRILSLLISPELTYPNLFDAHPPFQIDGNFGGVSGIIEMLMQSRLGSVHAALDPAPIPEIELLPALPAAWPSGSVKGLKGRGALEVDLEWADGALTVATVRSVKDGAVRLRYRSTTQVVNLVAGQDYQWRADPNP